MASLPLFSLPFFALEEFVRCLTPVELFILSMCSRRAARLVPFSNSKKFEMKLDTAGIIRINHDHCFMFREMPMVDSTLFNCKSLGCTARLQSHGGIATYWRDIQEGVFELSFHLSELFHCPIRSITYSPQFHHGVSREHFCEYLRKVMRRQNGIDCIRIWRDGGRSPNGYKEGSLQTFQNLNVTEFVAKLDS